MAGKIPQQFIDDLLDRVDIVEVIDQRVPLKKTGREYVACCPFHNEKTPSFTVSPTKQFYHCFGCGAHGNAIGFLMEYEHAAFPEVVEELAHRAGMEVPREAAAANQAARVQQPLYEVMQHAAVWYWRQWREHPGAVRAIDYLKRRGLNDEVVRQYRIGFAPPGWDNLARALTGTTGPKLLIEAGLMVEKEEGRRYDRFRDRVMFPIRDHRGRVIAFGGRVLGDEKPKYLNSPETPIFHKGRELYGLYEARQALRRIDRLLVVEGYMDVVALAQSGIHYAVATLGTSVTPDHLERLFRVTDEVVFCFDGDRAGRDAAWRGLENALPLMTAGRQVRFMFLPEGEDPDSLVRRIGAPEFEARIAEAEPLSGFLIKALGERVDLGSLEGEAKLIELARPLLSKVPAGVYRDKLAEKLAQESRTDPGRLGVPGIRPAARPRNPTPRRERGRRGPSLVRRAVQLLVQEPDLAEHCGDPALLRPLRQPGIDLLADLIELLRQRPHLNTGNLLEHWRDTEEGRYLGQLAANPVPEEVDRAEELREALAALERQAVQERKKALEQRFAQLTDAEREELKRLQQAVNRSRTGKS